jgi:hypothetical protein
MRIQITQSFRHATTPRPFLACELVTVPDDLGRTWIAEGMAIAFAGDRAQLPPLHVRGDDGRAEPSVRRRRETATRVV